LKAPEQFTLPLPQARPAATGRADFFMSAANAAALAAVEGWHDWPQGKLVVVGPAGAGKSHLARIWAAEADAALLPATVLATTDLPALVAHARVALDDAHKIAGDADAERALFHLHNMLAASGGHLLMTAPEAPNRWPVALPDLASRLQAAPVARLDRPDDALLSAVLVKLFADRQLHVAPAVIAYLATRIDRSLADAARVVAAIDRHSLTAHREITRAFAAEVLDSLPEAGQ
jgi:DnaA regulatory inactivator Hda